MHTDEVLGIKTLTDHQSPTNYCIGFSYSHGHVWNVLFFKTAESNKPGAQPRVTNLLVNHQNDQNDHLDFFIRPTLLCMISIVGRFVMI